MADYQAIVDAIDAAILAGVAGPGELTTSDGRSIKYRDLTTLRNTRNYYVRLANTASGKKRRTVAEF